jgi:hypothetical protein
MKKRNLIYIFIIALLSISCSSDDDSSNSNTNSINPPQWIQGTWLIELDEGIFGPGFRFTQDDFCTINGQQTNCWKGLVELNQGTTIEETIEGENYIITLNSLNVTSTTIHFRKYSETEIQVIDSSGLNPIYKKQ